MTWPGGSRWRSSRTGCSSVGALDKVLLAADMLEPAALGEDEAHEHLMKDCPWYRNVSE